MTNINEDEIIQKLNNGIKLSERELSYLTEYSIKDIIGENRRWSRGVSSIIEFNNQTYILFWENGLTEYQENEFYEQPIKVKVEKETKIVTFEVTNYIDESTGELIESIEKEITEKV